MKTNSKTSPDDYLLDPVEWEKEYREHYKLSYATTKDWLIYAGLIVLGLSLVFSSAW